MTPQNLFIPYGRQSVTEEDIQAVVDALRSDWLTCGPAVERFERELAEYCGAKHVIALSNGTAALHVAMLAAGVGSGDRVFTSPNTFLASANCAEYVGATADFIDIDFQTYNLDPNELAAQWQDDVKAVVAVDFAGLPCRMQEIAAIARKQGAVVIEDAAHALGSRFVTDGKECRVGSHPWADMTTFSFHPVKTITTGEGGAIATNDDELAQRCRAFRSHGMQKTRPEEPWFYEMQTPGYNYRITR
jgi:dTDP-4-amino-4,6-dideoxygalactose transaminase